MTQDERLALIWEASEALGDDPLLLAVLFALQDEDLRADLRALIAASSARRVSTGHSARTCWSRVRSLGRSGGAPTSRGGTKWAVTKARRASWSSGSPSQPSTAAAEPGRIA